MNIRVETWLGHKIRFVEKNPNDWWAVLADVTTALELSAREVKRRLPKDVVSKHPLETSGGIQEMLIVNEYGIYETVFESRKKEANKAVSNMFGHPKALKKDQMTPEMLVPRQEVPNETVNLMALSEKFNLDLSISKAIYGKYH